VPAAMEGRIERRPVDLLDVTILVDHSADLLMSLNMRRAFGGVAGGSHATRAQPA